MTPEFSRTLDAETVSDAPRQMEIGADEAERRRLAGRFRLKGIDRLAAEITLSRRAGIIHAEGVVRAAVVQACVVTAEPIPAEVEAPFSVRFVPDAYEKSDGDETELSEDDCETLPLEDGRIDLGELVAETMALALDPYPRCANADEALNEMGVADQAGSGAFAALEALKGQIARAKD